MTRFTFAFALLAALSSSKSARATELEPSADAWRIAELGGVRGVTVGPIENSRHPGVGYGSPACDRTMREARAMGATWVSVTPFGRVWDLKSTGVDLTFEADFQDNRRAVLAAIRQAHARGLKVMLVPHLWVESGGWRAEIDPGSDEGWKAWAASYERFLLAWTEVAKEGEAEMLSVGVELRSWATTERVPSLLAIVAKVRAMYPGLLTYSANWDDADRSIVFEAVDVLGVNAFFPLAEHEHAPREELMQGGRKVAQELEALASSWRKPVLLTEMGYTTRSDPAVKPWEWPDAMSDVKVDQAAQADAYRALLAPLLDAPWCAGFFAWRVYSDPDDVSQEAEWGFSPRGKLAELVLRDAFAARWAVDGPFDPMEALFRPAAKTPGVYPELSP